MRMIVNTRLVHLVTIEDPIEFLLKDNLGAVTQREVGTDTPSFAAALRNALRQDPDVIMVGEMRDLPTIQTVLTAAETGHLVFSTLHTNSAAQTIDRIIDQFPEGNHRQIRQQLATVLQGDHLAASSSSAPTARDSIAAVEILRHSPRVAKLILRGQPRGARGGDRELGRLLPDAVDEPVAGRARPARRGHARDRARGQHRARATWTSMLRKFLYAAENGAARRSRSPWPNR